MQQSVTNARRASIRPPSRRTVQQLCGLVAVLLVTACATPMHGVDSNTQRQSALDRWNRCIDQHSVSGRASLDEAISHVASRCDGHRRDIIATFPPYQQQQVNDALKDRTRRRATARLVETALGERTVEAQTFEPLPETASGTS